jgi:archaellum component FlaC
MKNIKYKLIGVFIVIVLIFNSCFKDDLLKEINALKTQVSDMQKRNDSLNNVLNVRADSLSKALASAQKRSDSLSNVLRTKSDSLSLALGLTNANLANLTKSVDSIKTQIASISGQLTQLNLQLTSITSQLTQLNQQLGALGGDVSQLAAQYQTLSASLQTINTEIATLQTEQLKLLEKLNAILLQLNPPIDLTTGLVAYYPFSGNAGDSSGNGNHGSVNGAILATDRFGKVNSAYSFASSTISVPYKPYLSFSDTKKFSVSIWVYTSVNNRSTHYLGMRQPGSQGQFWQLYTAVTSTVNGIAFQSFTNGNILGPFAQNQQIPLNQWTNVVGTYDSSVWKLYLNGIMIQAANSTIAFNNDINTPLTIGNSGNFEPFNGRLDDVRIYNRALTQAEITSLANN